ncbi:hypothetical protein UFOVP35_28 [uncultured Caudovirales phage]|uniref:Uncharacterized protein n=1 Tax=uncultured Caudovirales phage TaxID=2100421 RepID=A0A6J5KU62_9CAUD|nr:hypothetical protein UFOVP35_28 [uncultured Caudovirales phage]CAB4124427.1 hypothetical protein UFOVP52_19 [uncultured Caudovirales phage]CAB5219846.1 hypothetical protein UFOVP234_44 [uncultured Caudovirales phage]
MDMQMVVNGLAAVVGAAFGFWLKIVWNAISDLSKDISILTKDLHQDYVRRDDFLEAIKRIEQSCDRIFDKLDKKADK